MVGRFVVWWLDWFLVRLGGRLVHRLVDCLVG